MVNAQRRRVWHADTEVAKPGDSMHGTWVVGWKQLPDQAHGKGMGELQRLSVATKGTTIHTLVTSNGSPYLNFQNRIM